MGNRETYCLSDSHLKRNNKVSIKFGHNPIYTGVFFFYTFLSYANHAFDIPSVILQASLYLFFGISFLKILTNQVTLPFQYILWYGSFVCLSLISILYSTSQSYALDNMNKIFMAFLFGLAISILLKTENGLKKCINSIIISASIIGLYLVITYTLEHGTSRLGESFGVNPNLMGLMYLLPLCFLFLKLYRKEKLLINSILITICGSNVLLTGSKKALLGFLIFTLVYLISDKKLNKRIRNFFVFTVMLVSVYLFIMNTPELYNVIGNRFVLMIEDLFGDSVSSTSSTSIRIMMIDYGLKLFSDNPILGVGINNYAYYSVNIVGWNVYAHNNYIEILADLGLIGFAVYYSIHYKLGVKFIKLLRENNSGMAGLGLALLSLVLFYDFAMVSYYSTTIITIFSIMLYGVTSSYSKKI